MQPEPLENNPLARASKAGLFRILARGVWLGGSPTNKKWPANTKAMQRLVEQLPCEVWFRLGVRLFGSKKRFRNWRLSRPACRLLNWAKARKEKFCAGVTRTISRAPVLVHEWSTLIATDRSA